LIESQSDASLTRLLPASEAFDYPLVIATWSPDVPADRLIGPLKQHGSSTL